jgi:putative selenate reductase FAD-binding subunit
VITKYYRPPTLDVALTLAARPDAVIVGGGTTVSADPDLSPVVAIDLQALELSGIELSGDTVRIGATTRLQEVVDSDLVPDVLRDLAHRDAPNTIRNAATIGGTIGTADPGSQLLTGLLAFGATVAVTRAGSTTGHTLNEILDDPGLLDGAIITSVTAPSNGTAASARTARTPMDQPIVMAIARRDSKGAVVLAMAGVAGRPVTVDPDRIGDLGPPSDFRGSSVYRTHLASVLAGRVLAALTGGE